MADASDSDAALAEGFYAALNQRDAELSAAIRAFVKRIELLGVRASFGEELLLLVDHPTDGPPIPLGRIDREGRVSIDELSGHVPPKYAVLYARDLQGLIGRGHQPMRCTIVADDGSKPLVSMLLSEPPPDRWDDAIERFMDQAQFYFEVRATGHYVDGWLLDDEDD